MRNDVLNQILENIGGEKLPTDSNDRNRILSAINVQLGGEPFPLDAQRNDILRAINNSFGGETQPEFTARREFLLAIEKATHVDGVTFESYSEDSILAAIEFNTREGGLAGWTPNYKGAGYITIEPWHGKAGDTIEMTVVLGNAIGIQALFGTVDGTGNGHVYMQNGAIDWDGTPDTLEVHVDDVVVPKYTKLSVGIEYKLKFKILTVIPATDFIGCLKEGSYPFNGSITDIKFTNQDGSDNRHYPSIIKQKEQPTTLFLENKLGKFGVDEWSVDYAGTGCVKLNKPWVASAGDTASFEMTPTTLDAWNYLLYGTGLAYVALKDGALRFSGSSLVSITPATPIVVGTTYKVVVEIPNVDKIGANATGDWQFNGNITNIHFNSETDSRHYPSIIKSTTQPTTDVLEEVLGEYSSKDYTVGYANTGYVKLDKPWVGEVGSRIEMTVTWVDTSSNLMLFDNPVRNYAYINKVTGLIASNNSISSVKSLVSGVPTVVTFTLKNDGDVSSIGSNHAGLNQFNGSIHDIKFYNSKGELERHYPSLIHSETKPTTLVLEDIVSGENGTLTGFTAGTEWDNSLSNHGVLTGFGYEELPPPSSSRMGYYNSSTLTYSKDKPTQQQTDKSARSQYMTLYREKKVYDGWTNKMGKHGVMNGFAVGEGWKEV